MVQSMIVMSQEHLNAKCLLQLDQVVHQSNQHNFKIHGILALLHQFSQQRIQISANHIFIPKTDCIE
ncbi:hypothetical protein D1872_289510 [compost metagenome]